MPLILENMNQRTCVSALKMNHPLFVNLAASSQEVDHKRKQVLNCRNVSRTKWQFNIGCGFFGGLLCIRLDYRISGCPTAKQTTVESPRAF